MTVGSSWLLAGPNGSGKTTLLRLIAGLHSPTRGELSVFGHPLPAGRLDVRSRVSLVSHKAYLYGRMTAVETVRLWARLLDVETDESKIREELSRVGLGERSDVPVGGFSAGMRKRLTMVRTRIERPDLVLLDEPFSALDPEGREMIENWVRSFREQGATLVVASHDLARAARLCDQAIAIDRGQVLWRGAASDLPPEGVRARHVGEPS